MKALTSIYIFVNTKGTLANISIECIYNNLLMNNIKKKNYISGLEKLKYLKNLQSIKLY